MPCYIDGCNGKIEAYGLCKKHYRRIKAHGTPDGGKYSRASLEVRFWRKVEKKSENECWTWLGSKTPKGYGSIIKDDGSKKKIGAHRASYIINKGEIPDGLYILHSCDNTSCVNPNHLRAGTQSENIKEAFDKDRKTQPILFGEENPKSKLTIEQVKFIKANPQLGHKHIADMFGLSPNCIRGVRIGRTWKEVI
jgi:hypothetical protein